ncbi:hypothetical protein HBI56_076040 [Parastagonospora nodorum]|uniref:Uncharacterized protein n=1 Tax=Phaeosphaeria nodorum (strain SN15 / ATCC MYA-4574 / FGSC 10173) TaxID=321614 RepID=A0A7U2HWB3_PHANO|nr:hypothetical protein HBH56_151120 [Parastagonospora nodorum]QRC94320.1 hypothetical protein JI435_405620 [Parastagonospora nodorum SN15]KAH3928279.1 hypothetical protein HBH54_137020 [Parastagonospora nodorum]KAH3946164.1 hypothetical protein HBH53_138580 [Parastagonospora nodorum]KAH3984092.1 hypothetical protein HBH52_061370 [Parastagonospora nodorum]
MEMSLWRRRQCGGDVGRAVLLPGQRRNGWQVSVAVGDRCDGKWQQTVNRRGSCV